MLFYICIEINRKSYFLKVERVHLDERTERFKVSGKNRFVVVENNRPFFRNRRLRTHNYDWKMVEGEKNYQSTFEKITEALEKAIE